MVEMRRERQNKIRKLRKQLSSHVNSYIMERTTSRWKLVVKEESKWKSGKFAPLLKVISQKVSIRKTLRKT